MKQQGHIKDDFWALCFDHYKYGDPAVRDSTNVEPGFCVCGFCFTCIRKSASLEKKKLNGILERDYQDKAGCISSRDVRVLQRLLLLPHFPSCTYTTPTLKGPHGKLRGPRALGLFISEGHTRWLYNHPD